MPARCNKQMAKWQHKNTVVEALEATDYWFWALFVCIVLKALSVRFSKKNITIHYHFKSHPRLLLKKRASSPGMTLPSHNPWLIATRRAVAFSLSLSLSLSLPPHTVISYKQYLTIDYIAMVDCKPIPATTPCIMRTTNWLNTSTTNKDKDTRCLALC